MTAVECPGCGESFDSEQGMRVHRGRYCDSTPWADPSVLKELYYDEGLTLCEIADRLDGGREAVRSQMEKHDLPRKRPKPWRDETVLREMYCERKLSTFDIADALDTNRESVRKGLEYHGVERRPASESSAIAARRKPASYFTAHDGYERWSNKHNGTESSVSVHRLAAVAWFGISAVKGRFVHHKKPIPWLNTEGNLKPMEPSEHSRLHATEDIQHRERDDGGRLC